MNPQKQFATVITLLIMVTAGVFGRSIEETKQALLGDWYFNNMPMTVTFTEEGQMIVLELDRPDTSTYQVTAPDTIVIMGDDIVHITLGKDEIVLKGDDDEEITLTRETTDYTRDILGTWATTDSSNLQFRFLSNGHVQYLKNDSIHETLEYRLFGGYLGLDNDDYMFKMFNDTLRLQEYRTTKYLVRESVDKKDLKEYDARKKRLDDHLIGEWKSCNNGACSSEEFETYIHFLPDGKMIVFSGNFFDTLPLYKQGNTLIMEDDMVSADIAGSDTLIVKNEYNDTTRFFRSTLLPDELTLLEERGEAAAAMNILGQLMSASAVYEAELGYYPDSDTLDLKKGLGVNTESDVWEFSVNPTDDEGVIAKATIKRGASLGEIGKGHFITYAMEKDFTRTYTHKDFKEKYLKKALKDAKKVRK